jgi:hypothetical protein
VWFGDSVSTALVDLPWSPASDVIARHIAENLGSSPFPGQQVDRSAWREIYAIGAQWE